MNLLEVEEKEKFAFEGMSTEGSETDSPAGRIAGELQQKTYRIFQRIRWTISNTVVVNYFQP